MNAPKLKRELRPKDWRLIRSFAEEVKKVAYLGAAGPYLLMGDTASSIVGGATVLAIAVVWFMICQAVAHALIAAANAGEKDNERQ